MGCRVREHWHLELCAIRPQPQLGWNAWSDSKVFESTVGSNLFGFPKLYYNLVSEVSMSTIFQVERSGEELEVQGDAG